MANITTIIPIGNLEKIRDQIATIVKMELDNQATLQIDPNLTGKVFIERFTPVDKSEGTVLIVYVDQGTFSDQTQVTQRGKFNFNIDVYCWDLQTDTEEGYFRSGRKLHRIANLVHNILQNPIYKTLGFLPGIIYNRTVTGMKFDTPNGNNDTNFSRMGRVILSVDFHNQQPHEIPITASGYDAKVKLEESEKGFYYSTNN